VAVICCAAHDVGLTMNPGRSISTSTERSRSGTPLRIVGSGSLTTEMCASVGLTKIACLITTVSRSNGPATARTATDSL